MPPSEFKMLADRETAPKNMAAGRAESTRFVGFSMNFGYVFIPTPPKPLKYFLNGFTRISEMVPELKKNPVFRKNPAIYEA